MSGVSIPLSFTHTHTDPQTDSEIDRLQRHYRGQTFADSDDECEYEVLMVYHDAGFVGDELRALVRNTATGAVRCRPPVSVEGYLAWKLPLPPSSSPTSEGLRLQRSEEPEEKAPAGAGGETVKATRKKHERGGKGARSPGQLVFRGAIWSWSGTWVRDDHEDAK